MQQVLWSGSLAMVNNPALANRLDLLLHIDMYGRLYVPRSVFHFNDAQPLLTTVNLPRATTASEEPFVAAQLALSHRCFHRAFGSSSSEFLRVFKSYSSILQLFLVPRNTFFTPLYNSKTQVMAANILNSMFGEMFASMQVPHDQHPQLFAQLCFSNPDLPPALAVQFVTSSVNGDTLLENVFQDGGLVPDCLLEFRFTKLWRMAYSVIPYLNW